METLTIAALRGQYCRLGKQWYFITNEGKWITTRAPRTTQSVISIPPGISAPTGAPRKKVSRLKIGLLICAGIIVYNFISTMVHYNNVRAHMHLVKKGGVK